MRRRQEQAESVAAGQRRTDRLAAAWQRWQPGTRSRALIDEFVAVIVDCLEHHEQPMALYHFRLSDDPAAKAIAARVQADDTWLADFREL